MSHLRCVSTFYTPRFHIVAIVVLFISRLTVCHGQKGMRGSKASRALCSYFKSDFFNALATMINIFL